MRCPDCGTVVWYGDEDQVIRCALGHPKDRAPDAKTKVRTPASAGTKTVSPDDEGEKSAE